MTEPVSIQTAEEYEESFEVPLEDFPDLDETAFLPASTGEAGGVAGSFEVMFPNNGPIGGQRQRVADVGKALKGVPFMFGGDDPENGFDGPGLTRYVMKQIGVELPKHVPQQASYGQPVPVEQAQKGDLIAWQAAPRSGGVPHVAIYLGDGRVIEAPRPGMGVRVRELSPDEGAYGVQLNY